MSEKILHLRIKKGPQSYRCSGCLNNLSADNKGVQPSTQFIWFRKWIMKRQVFQYLIRDSIFPK